jgi:hypothetical protein
MRRHAEDSALLRSQNKIYAYHNHSPTALGFIQPNKELNPEADIRLYELEHCCIRAGGLQGEWAGPQLREEENTYIYSREFGSFRIGDYIYISI